MRDFRLSTTSQDVHPALAYGYRLATGLPPWHGREPMILGGAGIPLAGASAWALAERQAIVLPPNQSSTRLAGRRVTAEPAGLRLGSDSGYPPLPVTWDVGFFTSGSTGTPKGFGFTIAQLDQLAAWYTTIYQVTTDSVIVTALPVGYNFTFVAGLYLAACLGARLHLARDPAIVFRDVQDLAPRHDRCVVLANPVVLEDPPQRRLPSNVLIDSGGAPMSITAISHYRNHVADLREGYGLTETGSLTHFDAEADDRSLGTVGRPVPGVTTNIDPGTGLLTITSPAIGRPLAATSTRHPHGTYRTSDLGRIDPDGRLRLLGRADDHRVGGLWPRDLLDVLGPVLRTRCATIHHPESDRIRIRLTHAADPSLAGRLQAAASTATGTDPSGVRVDGPDRPLLPSLKIPRPTALPAEG